MNVRPPEGVEGFRTSNATRPETVTNIASTYRHDDRFRPWVGGNGHVEASPHLDKRRTEPVDTYPHMAARDWGWRGETGNNQSVTYTHGVCSRYMEENHCSAVIVIAFRSCSTHTMGYLFC